MIVTILRAHPSLRYFQGYHDVRPVALNVQTGADGVVQIVSVLLLTFGDVERTVQSTERLSLHRVRDSMGVGLEPVLGYLKCVSGID